jgi:4-hydroxybenzoate polyprenyltransferase
MALQMLRRVLKERRLFVRWSTPAFTAVFAIPLIWEFYGSVDLSLLFFMVLACLGGGWLMAFYMWHLNDAIQYDVGPLRPSKRQETEREAGDKH